MCRVSTICLFVFLIGCVSPSPPGDPAAQPQPPSDVHVFVDVFGDQPDELEPPVADEVDRGSDPDPDPTRLPSTIATRMELRPIPTGPVPDETLFSESRVPVTNPGFAVARPMFYDVEENEVCVSWQDLGRLEIVPVSAPVGVTMIPFDGELVFFVHSTTDELEEVAVRVIGEFEDRTLEAEFTLVVHPVAAEVSLVFAPSHARIGQFAWYQWAHVLPGEGVDSVPMSSTVLAGGSFRGAVTPFLRLSGPEGATYVPPAFLDELTWDDGAELEWLAERLFGNSAGTFDIAATFTVAGEEFAVDETIEVLAPWTAHDLFVVADDYQTKVETRLRVGECEVIHASLAVGDEASALFPQEIAWPYVTPVLDESIARLDSPTSAICGVSGGETELHFQTDVFGTAPRLEATHRVVVE